MTTCVDVQLREININGNQCKIGCYMIFIIINRHNGGLKTKKE